MVRNPEDIVDSIMKQLKYGVNSATNGHVINAIVFILALAK